MRQMGNEMRFHELTMKLEADPQRFRCCQQFQNDLEDCETVGVQKREEAGGQEKQKLREVVGGHTSKG